MQASNLPPLCTHDSLKIIFMPSLPDVSVGLGGQIALQFTTGRDEHESESVNFFHQFCLEL